MTTATAPATAPPSVRPLLPLLICLGLFCLLAALFRVYTCDDSFITFRYAQNLAAGLGPVYNPGDLVEGYSNPLWLALLTLGLKLGLDPLTASKLLGLLCGVGALLAAYGIITRLSERDPAAPWGLLLLATSAGLAYYTVSGMETALYAALLTTACYCCLLPGKAPWAAATLCGLAAACTRPEGVAVLLGLLLWRGLRPHHPEGPGPRLYWLSVAVSLALLAALELLRYRTFGQWLPNTFYAKPPGAFGGMSYLAAGTYLKEYLQTGGNGLWLALLLWPLLASRWRYHALVPLGLVAVQFALVVHARGDWMALSRFLVPVTPLLVACGYAALLRCLSPRPLLAALVLLIVALNAVHLAENLGDFRAGQYPQNVMAGEPQRLAGEWVRDHFPAGALIATKRIGGVGYYSGHRILDTLGLTDHRLARIRHSSESRGPAEQQAIAREVFSRRPEAIMLAVMKRWDQIPLDQPAPDVAGNLRDVDNAIYAGLASHGYRFLQRLPQGGSGEFAVYVKTREGATGPGR